MSRAATVAELADVAAMLAEQAPPGPLLAQLLDTLEPVIAACGGADGAGDPEDPIVALLTQLPAILLAVGMLSDFAAPYQRVAEAAVRDAVAALRAQEPGSTPDGR